MIGCTVQTVEDEGQKKTEKGEKWYLFEPFENWSKIMLFTVVHTAEPNFLQKFHPKLMCNVSICHPTALPICSKKRPL